MKRKYFLGIVFAFVIIFFCGCTTDEDSAKQAYKEKDYQKVVSLLKDKKDKTKESNEILLLSTAHVALKEKKYDEALKIVESVEGDESKKIAQQCNYNLFKIELNPAVKNNDHESTVNIYTKYQGALNDENKTKITNDLIDSFNSKATANNLDSLLYLDNVASQFKSTKEFKDTKLTEALDKLIADNAESKMKLFLISTIWIRQDDTGLNGTKLKVQFNYDDGFASIEEATEFGKSVGFSNGDVKWRSIQFIDSQTFRYEDLSKGGSGNTYHEGISTINYEKKMITLHVTGNLNTQGDDQILVSVPTE